jgi:hypothetical protein
VVDKEDIDAAGGTRSPIIDVEHSSTSGRRARAV